MDTSRLDIVTIGARWPRTVIPEGFRSATKKACPGFIPSPRRDRLQPSGMDPGSRSLRSFGWDDDIGLPARTVVWR